MRLRHLLLVGVLAMFASVTRAADEERGKMLYENHCAFCHESQVHMREHNKVHNRSDMFYWVTRWAKELKLTWDENDVASVMIYINNRFYHFDE